MKLDKWHFANQAIESTCDAFYMQSFFGEEGYPSSQQEYYSELSCGKSLPELENKETNEDGTWILSDDYYTIQGVFHFLTDSASDLWLVCSYFAEKGEDFFVFFKEEYPEDVYPKGWVVWLPNAKHLN